MQRIREASASLRSSFAADFDPVEAVRLQRLGRLDPTLLLDERDVIRATHTPDGPATVRVHWDGARIEAEAWGDGARWALDRVPALCGAEDRPKDFSPGEAWLVALFRDHAYLRLGRALRPFDTLVAYVLQQRVRFADAATSWRRIVEHHGTPAPGPYALTLPLVPEQWRSLPATTLAMAGVDAQRSRILREVALHAAKIDRLDGAPLDEARDLLPRISGIGPWTAGMALGAGWGDPDAVATGDVHLPSIVGRAFTGQPAASDTQMLELLEPYKGQRFRVIRLLFVAGYGRRRSGPRQRRIRLTIP